MIAQGTPVEVRTDSGTWTGQLAHDYAANGDVQLVCASAPLGYWHLHHWRVLEVRPV